jgi:hypothetical protein
MRRTAAAGAADPLDDYADIATGLAVRKFDEDTGRFAYIGLLKQFPHSV